MKSSVVSASAIAVLVSAILSSNQAMAQTAAATASADAGTTLEEVVVTAQRREEKLMDVPMSISAFNSETLDKEGLRQIDDLTRSSPGVTFIRNGMGSSSNYNDESSDVSIRGIDSTGGASTTGIYIDDTPIQTRHLQFGTVNPYPVLFDLDRVEVLKGPQGTLFGAGSEGGNIRFITPTPNLNRYDGYARAEFGQIQDGGRNYEVGAAFGGPIIPDVLGFRISASFRQDGGWVDRVNYTAPASTLVNGEYTVYNGTPTVTNTTESNANWRNTATLHAALKWKAAEGLEITPSIFMQTLHINDTGAYWLNISDPANNVYRNGNAQTNPSTDPWYLAAIKVDWSLPWAQLNSNTSYLNRRQHSESDYTQWAATIFEFNQYPAPGDTSSAFFQDIQHNFTQEIRLSSLDGDSRLQWTAGVFLSHVNENTTEYIYSADIDNVLGAPAPNNLAYNQPVFQMVDKQVALFGEASFKLTPTVKLTAGLRVANLQYTGTAQESGALVGAVPVNSVRSGSSTPVTPRVVLNYQPEPDSLYYASAAKGFRPGGVNIALPPVCTTPPLGLPSSELPPSFSPDSLWQYELGSKNTLLDHRLQVSTSIYLIKWKNIQQFIYLPCGLGFVPNLGNVTGHGGDLELHYKATRDLSVGFTAAYTSNAFDSTQTLGTTGQGFTALNLVTADDHLPAAPWNFDINGEYVWNTVDRKPYFRADYQLSTAQNSILVGQDQNNAPYSDATLPGLPRTSVLALRGGLRFNGMDVSLFVQNALNFHTPIFVSRDLGTSTANGYGANFDTNYFGRGIAPRTFGITFTYRH